jgi:hypothetical protein
MRAATGTAHLLNRCRKIDGFSRTAMSGIIWGLDGKSKKRAQIKDASDDSVFESHFNAGHVVAAVHRGTARH